MKQQNQLLRNKSFKVLPQSDLEVEEAQVEEIEKEVVEDQKEASQDFMKKEAEERQEEIQK